MLKSKVFEVDTDRSDFGEKPSELPRHIIDANDQAGKVLGESVFARNPGNPCITGGETVGNGTTGSGSRRVRKCSYQRVQVLPIAFENTDDLLGIRVENLQPQFGLA